MALNDSRVILVLACMFSIGALLQLLRLRLRTHTVGATCVVLAGCVLYNNWWPMLAGIMYVLVPMPYLFFGSGGDGYSVYGSPIQSGWIDAGKFLTGFSAVGSIAIPAILAHAKIIAVGALIMELAAALVLGATVVTYDYFSSKDAGYY